MNPKLEDFWIRSILMISNPVIIWGGIAAVGFAGNQVLSEIVKSVKWNSAEAGKKASETISKIFEKYLPEVWITIIFSTLYFSWAVIPHRNNYYYYFYPAAMTLSLALSCGLDRLEILKKHTSIRTYLRWMVLSLSGITFAYYFPLISGIKIILPWVRFWIWIYRDFPLPIPL
jgi:hypothetical protein